MTLPNPPHPESSNTPIDHHPHPMDSITLLTRPGPPHLTPEEDARLTQQLSAAYHMDEAATTNRDVQRIAEKIRALMEQQPPSQNTAKKQ